MDAATVMFIIQSLLSVAGIVLWNVFTDVKEQARNTQKEFADYKVQVAKEYVSREEIDKIISSLNRTVEQHSIIMSERFNRLEHIIEKVRDKE